MQATRYQTGHDPHQIARDAIGETPGKLTYGEQAAQAAIVAVFETADVSEALTKAVLARVAFAAAAPHIAAIVLREAAVHLPDRLRDAEKYLHDFADAYDPIDHVIARGDHDAARYRLGGDRD